MLVSHDRYLLEACAEQLWIVEDGRVRVFDGDVDDYARHVLSKTRGEEPRVAVSIGARPPKPPVASKVRRDPGSARRQLANAEEKVEKLTTLLAAWTPRWPLRTHSRATATRPRASPRNATN